MLKSKKPKPDAESKAEPEAGPPKELAGTAVTLVGATEAHGVVTVHGRVRGQDVHVPFRHADLAAIEDEEARSRYIARQVKAAAEQEEAAPRPQAPSFPVRGTHHV